MIQEKQEFRTLHFHDAGKSMVPRAFGVIVKPVGATCNLRCDYCYYLDKGKPAGLPVMTDEVLETVTRQWIEGNDVPELSICWHGGEPLLAGMGFFEKALRLQRKYAGSKRIINSLQTNGTVLNDEWCRFFSDHEVLVGISIDGPEEIHDAFRRSTAGSSVFKKVMDGIELLQKWGVAFNTLTTVNRKSEGEGKAIYHFLKSLGSRFMQFLPVYEQITAQGRMVSPYNSQTGFPGPTNVGSRAYGDFMIDVFTEWVREDVGKVYVQLFDEILAGWYGIPGGLCVFSGRCGDNPVVESGGEVYCCDHFVYSEFRLGNVKHQTLSQMHSSSVHHRFCVEKRNGLPRKCLQCDYLFLCRGGCLKHRFGENGDRQGVNRLCEGYKAIYNHTESYMKRMVELLRQGQPPASIMEEIY